MNLYEGLKFRVDLITDESMPKELDSLFKIPSFDKFLKSVKRKKFVKHRIIKYIGLMYDPKSPFPIEYIELKKRKKAVAVECNFSMENEDTRNTYNDKYRDFMELRTEESIELILDFLKNIHYSVWTEIQTTEQELSELTELRWEKITTKTTKTSKKEGEDASYKADVADKDIFDATNKKEKLMDASKKRRVYLKELYEEMYADNLDVKAAEREIPISPENAMSFV